MSFAPMPGVHALTDVTGFGLLGHLHGVCRASRVGARIDFSRVPLHPGVLALASAGLVTGASARNWAAVSNEVSLSGAIGEFERAVLTDPQTSGGLLVACAPEATKDVFAVFEREGFDRAAVIGDFVSGPSTIAVQ
jgi:selenide,water dikinase